MISSFREDAIDLLCEMLPQAEIETIEGFVDNIINAAAEEVAAENSGQLSGLEDVQDQGRGYSTIFSF